MALLTPVFAEELLDDDDPATTEAIVGVGPDVLSCHTRKTCYCDSYDYDITFILRKFHKLWKELVTEGYRSFVALLRPLIWDRNTTVF